MSDQVDEHDEEGGIPPDQENLGSDNTVTSKVEFEPDDLRKC